MRCGARSHVPGLLDGKAVEAMQIGIGELVARRGSNGVPRARLLCA